MEAVWLLTTSEAEAVVPFPPSAEVIAVVVLFFVPAVVLVTVTSNVQLLFAASDPPVNSIVFGAVVASEPPQIEVAPVVGTVRPESNESLKPISLKAVFRFGLVIVKVSAEVFPVKMEVGEKDLARTGGAITAREAVA
jgi:hypothetical protein